MGMLKASRSQGGMISNYDEELGSQPCIFRSVTPVSVPLLFENQPINNRDRLGTMRTFQDLRDKMKSHSYCAFHTFTLSRLHESKTLISEQCACKSDDCRNVVRR